MQDKKLLYSAKIQAGETILDMKKKVANILGTNDNCVTLVYSGMKMTNNNTKFSEIEFYEQGSILAVVNGVCNY